MAKRTSKFSIYPANLGIDQSSIPGAANPAALYRSDNIIFTVNGSRKHFWGIDNFYVSGIPAGDFVDMRGMIDFWRNNAGVMQHKTVMFCNAKLYADALADGNFSDVTGSNSLVSTDRVVWSTFYGLLMAFFEGSEPLAWTQTGDFVTLQSLVTAAGGGTVPNGSIARVHLGRLWIAGVDLYPHRLYYSSVGTPLDWNIPAAGSAGYIDIDLEDSDPVGITAIFPGFRGDLYVAKRRALYRVREMYSADLSTTTFALEPVSLGVGCIEHNSAAATTNDIIWASDRGIHSLLATDKYGDVEATFVSFPVNEDWKQNTDFSRSKNMWAMYNDEMNSYLLAYTKKTGSTTNNEMFCYNPILGNIYSKSNFDCAAICSHYDDKKRVRTLVGMEGRNVGFFNDEKTSDFGEKTKMQFVTPLIYPAGRPDVTVTFKNLWVFVKPQTTGTVQVAYKVDDQDIIETSFDQSGGTNTGLTTTGAGSLIGSSTIGTAVIGLGGASEMFPQSKGLVKKVCVPMKGVGSGVQIAFYHEQSDGNTDEDCEIFGYSIEVEYAEDSQIPTTV